jgi:hypothetical protein
MDAEEIYPGFVGNNVHISSRVSATSLIPLYFVCRQIQENRTACCHALIMFPYARKLDMMNRQGMR